VKAAELERELATVADDPSAIDTLAMSLIAATGDRMAKNGPPFKPGDASLPDIKRAAITLLARLHESGQPPGWWMFVLVRELLGVAPRARNEPQRGVAMAAAAVLEAMGHIKSSPISVRAIAAALRVDRKAVDKWRARDDYKAMIEDARARLLKGERLSIGKGPIVQISLR
jgi:hypothetical protein